MKRRSRPRKSSFATALLAACAICSLGHAAPPPSLAAASAILLDAATGEILYEKNPHERRPIASTTKIMTALLATENCRPGEIATVSEHATRVDGSRLGLEPGERINVEALLSALLLKSANDAAVALAEHVGGSTGGFVHLMNQRARSLGARQTRFCNPHGLYAPEHLSTAHDLGLIARQAMKNPRFRRLVSARTCSLRRPDGSSLLLVNHNRLLFQDPNVDGIKSGYVRQSGPCLVASAERGGWRLIAVLLDSKALWQEAKALLDYGFTNWEATVFASTQRPFLGARVIGGRSRLVPLLPEDDLVEVRPAGFKSRALPEVEIRRLFAPIRKGERLGRVRLLREGEEVASTWLVAGKSVSRSGWFAALYWFANILFWGALLLGSLKLYGKIAKIARRRRHRLQAQG